MKSENWRAVPRTYLVPFAALAAALGFLAILLGLQGTIGLLEWNPVYRNVVIGIIIAGTLPFLVYAISVFLGRAGMRILARISGVAAIVLSAAVFLGFISAGILLFSETRQFPPAADATAFKQILPGSGTPLTRLAFSSDSHFGSGANNPEATRDVFRSVEKGSYDAFFILGDLAEQGVPGTGFEQAAAMIGQELAKTPVATVMGNHDALIGGEWRYRHIFNPRLYYRLDSGTTHVIALNVLWGTESFDRRQRQWLADELASIPKEDTMIVVMHCYIRASGYRDAVTGLDWFDHKDMIREVAPILENGGVDLVVSGHNHFMEYLEHGKTGYAVVGALGGRPDPEPVYISPESRWREIGTFGYLEVLVGDGSLELTFRDKNGAPIHTETKKTR